MLKGSIELRGTAESVVEVFTSSLGSEKQRPDLSFQRHSQQNVPADNGLIHCDHFYSNITSTVLLISCLPVFQKNIKSPAKLLNGMSLAVS